MRVRLIRKLANSINGIDLKKVHVGEVVDLSHSEANMLVAEGWAEALTENRRNQTNDKIKPSASD